MEAVCEWATDRGNHSMERRGRRGASGAQASRWILNEVDGDGIGRIYAEQTTEAEHRAWCATDPLRRPAQQAMFARLLSSRKTRDTALRINIAAAQEAGDWKTAMTLAQHLSAETWQRFLHGEEEYPPEANSQGSDHSTVSGGDFIPLPCVEYGGIFEARGSGQSRRRGSRPNRGAHEPPHPRRRLLAVFRPRTPGYRGRVTMPRSPAPVDRAARSISATASMPSSAAAMRFSCFHRSPSDSDHRLRVPSY